MCIRDRDVLGGVGQMVFATDDVADGHGGVVHGNGEVVQRRPVGAEDHEVAAEGAAVDLNVATDNVVEGDHAAGWNTEAYDRLAALGLKRGALGRGEGGAAAVVARGLVGGLLALALGIQLLRGAVAVIGLVLGQEPRGGRCVAPHSLHLAVWSVVAPLGLIAYCRSLVPSDPEPVEAVED